MSYEKKPAVEKTCEECHETYTSKVGNQKFCRDCSETTTSTFEKRLPEAGNPLRETRCRKLGDATPKGFLESVIATVARHNRHMQYWTFFDVLTGASMATAATMPLRIPKHWKIGGFEDLRMVFDSEEFQALCEKAELEFRYSHSHNVPCVVFTKAKPQK
jgi:hypothetical protein